MKPPPGFSVIREPYIYALVDENWVPYLRERGLLDPSDLFEGLLSPTFKGRGELLLVDEEVLVIKRNRHGGILGFLLGDLFLDGSRVHRELLLLWRLKKAEVPTLVPVASIGKKVGLFWKQFLITQYLHGADDMLSFLQATTDAKRRLTVLKRAGEVVSKMHDLGVYHGDLQLKNLLVRGEEVFVIDLDKSKQRIPLPMSMRFKNLLRLMRSVEKAEAKGLIGLSLKEKVAFWLGYKKGKGHIYKRELRKRLKLHPFRRLIWRLGWFLEGLISRLFVKYIA